MRKQHLESTAMSTTTWLRNTMLGSFSDTSSIYSMAQSPDRQTSQSSFTRWPHSWDPIKLILPTIEVTSHSFLNSSLSSTWFSRPSITWFPALNYLCCKYLTWMLCSWKDSTCRSAKFTYTSLCGTIINAYFSDFIIGNLATLRILKLAPWPPWKICSE